MVAAMGAVLAKLLTFMIFGRFHFHFFERQHNYRQLSANDCNEEIINTFSNNINIKKSITTILSLAVPREMY